MLDEQLCVPARALYCFFARRGRLAVSSHTSGGAVARQLATELRRRRRQRRRDELWPVGAILKVHIEARAARQLRARLSPLEGGGEPSRKAPLFFLRRNATCEPRPPCASATKRVASRNKAANRLSELVATAPRQFCQRAQQQHNNDNNNNYNNNYYNYDDDDDKYKNKAGDTRARASLWPN